MSTHSLGHHSSGLGFVTSLSGKPKTHGKGRRMEKTHFQLGEDEILLSLSLPQNPVQTLEKISKNILFYSNNNNNGLELLKLITRLRIREQRAEFVLSVNRQRFLAMLMLQLLRSFQFFCSFLRLSAHASTKTNLSSTVQKECLKQCYRRLNHECTHQNQFTYARINCLLKDLSCDTQLPKILMLAILATCASSRSTKKVDQFKIRKPMQCSH
ncbi:hypothetical protein H5410_037264 [Solanum commersonii]|uniref:Uncharacterized protein n=1 Tax=Solanum commersonii TaxID=4109 RepID=A0A9J5Y906_SOLCO|nr:hypothetical protein H5410_037264 [Solanum commersonii]